MPQEFKQVKKGLNTEKALLEALTGESKARVKYNLFAEVARKEGYEQIAAIFEETANNELEHAKIILKLLGENPKNTEEALKKAIEGEHYEWTKMYPQFQKIAREEGEEDAATFFKEVAEVETQHEARFKKLLENLKNARVFKKDKVVKWKCRNCGYVHQGREAPKECPNCKYPRNYFELYCENY
ncbi:MAG: rubrerythrin family protein [Candidatus Pacearchaeota archaeon]